MVSIYTYRFYTNRVVTNKKAGNSRSGYLPSMFFTYTKFPFFDRVCQQPFLITTNVDA